LESIKILVNSKFFQKKQIKKRETKLYFGQNKITFQYPRKTVVFPKRKTKSLAQEKKKYRTTNQIQKIFFAYFNPFLNLREKNLPNISSIEEYTQDSSKSISITNFSQLKNQKKDHVSSLGNLSFIRIRFIIAIHRRIQIGDKLAGRHGNKGILTQFVPEVEIPYIPNGIPLDLVFNPLGIPSRINVGQMYESIIGLAGFFLGERYFFPSFDERSQLKISSRTIVFEKLREARVKTRYHWLFNPSCPGKIPLFDGRTNEFVNQEVAIGNAYILKLVHIVDEKLHARSTGPYSLITQQPVRGRARNGGQRVGEIEIWALEGFGSAYVLQEILTVKSDDLIGRGPRLSEALFYNRSLVVELPDAFRVLSCELQALCLDVFLFSENNFLLNSMKFLSF
jgi:DNA-directed RNA polymerase subunit beta